MRPLMRPQEAIPLTGSRGKMAFDRFVMNIRDPDADGFLRDVTY
jgi:hypothetical protein